MAKGARNPNATEGTYTRHPFISKDGVDDNGIRAEVKVVVGYGDITKIAPTETGKSNKIEFQVANTEYFPSGYSRDQRLIDKLKIAQEANEPIHFRIETRRKGDVDRTRPFEDLDSNRGKEVVKSLAAVRLEGEDEWTISEDAVTRLDEDPQTGGNGLVSANKQSPDQLGMGSRPAANANSRGGDFEPAPYVAKWQGKVNPGSIAVAVPISFYMDIFNYEKERGFELTSDRRKEVAIVMLKIANRLQKDIFKKLDLDYKGVDLTAGSHTRARALIFEALRSFFPVTEETFANEEEFGKWQKNVYTVALAMWEWGIEVADEFVS